jgi:thiamine monophosphate kinase
MKRFRKAALGGRIRPLAISITALGAVLAQKIVPREGVAAGDLLYASGTIGDAALGLRLRLKSARSAARGLSFFVLKRVCRFPADHFFGRPIPPAVGSGEDFNPPD